MSIALNLTIYPHRVHRCPTCERWFLSSCWLPQRWCAQCRRRAIAVPLDVARRSCHCEVWAYEGEGIMVHCMEDCWKDEESVD